MVWWCTHFVILLDHVDCFFWKYAVIPTYLNEGGLKWLPYFAHNFVGAPLTEFSWFTHTKRLFIIKLADSIVHPMIYDYLLLLLPSWVKVIIADNNLVLNATLAQNLESLRHLLLSHISTIHWLKVTRRHNKVIIDNLSHKQAPAHLRYFKLFLPKPALQRRQHQNPISMLWEIIAAYKIVRLNEVLL